MARPSSNSDDTLLRRSNRPRRSLARRSSADRFGKASGDFGNAGREWDIEIEPLAVAKGRHDALGGLAVPTLDGRPGDRWAVERLERGIEHGSATRGDQPVGTELAGNRPL